MTTTEENRLVHAFPTISLHALEQFRKLRDGESAIDGNELGRLGLAYRTSWKHQSWALTVEGMKFVWTPKS